jgi:hypothetical protein
MGNLLTKALDRYTFEPLTWVNAQVANGSFSLSVLKNTKKQTVATAVIKCQIP